MTTLNQTLKTLAFAIALTGCAGANQTGSLSYGDNDPHSSQSGGLHESRACTNLEIDIVRPKGYELGELSVRLRKMYAKNDISLRGPDGEGYKMNRVSLVADNLDSGNYGIYISGEGLRKESVQFTFDQEDCGKSARSLSFEMKVFNAGDASYGTSDLRKTGLDASRTDIRNENIPASETVVFDFVSNVCPEGLDEVGGWGALFYDEKGVSCRKEFSSKEIAYHDNDDSFEVNLEIPDHFPCPRGSELTGGFSNSSTQGEPGRSGKICTMTVYTTNDAGRDAEVNRLR